MTTKHQRPGFELKRVFDNGNQDVRLLSLNEILHQDINEIKVTRRGFLGLSAFSTAILLAACSPQSSKPTTSASHTPTSSPTHTPTSSPTTTATPTITPTPTATNIPTETPVATPGQYAEVNGLPCQGQLAHGSVVRSVLFSPDGQYVVSYSARLDLKVWDAQTGALISSLDNVRAYALGPDSSHIAVSRGDSSIELWNFPDGENSFRGVLMAEVPAIVFSRIDYSPNGMYIAAWNATEGLYLFDVSSGSFRILSEVDPIFTGLSLSFSPDGNTLIMTSSDANKRHIWNVTTGELITETSGGIYGASYAPDGERVAAIIDNRPSDKIIIWDTVTRDVLLELSGPQFFAVTSVTFGPGGRQLVSTSLDNTVVLWDLDTGQMARVFRGHTSFTQAADFSPDGTRIVSGDNHGALKLWEIETGQQLSICFFDPEDTPSNVETITYEATDERGIARTYIQPCGAPIPADAICTCNCVAGGERPSGGSGGDGGEICTCDQICTCIPVFN